MAPWKIFFGANGLHPAKPVEVIFEKRYAAKEPKVLKRSRDQVYSFVVGDVDCQLVHAFSAELLPKPTTAIFKMPDSVSPMVLRMLFNAVDDQDVICFHRLRPVRVDRNRTMPPIYLDHLQPGIYRSPNVDSVIPRWRKTSI